MGSQEVWDDRLQRDMKGEMAQRGECNVTIRVHGVMHYKLSCVHVIGFMGCRINIE